MNRTAIVMLGLGLSLGAPSLQAQTRAAQPSPARSADDDDDDEGAIQIQPTPAPAAGPRRGAQAGQRPEDLTIEVTAEPPAGSRRAYDPGPGRSMYPPGYSRENPGPSDDFEPPPRPPRPPPTPDSAALRARSWSRHLVIGGSVGFGSPLGVLGLWADINPSPHFGFTVGGGLGGAFGAAFAITANIRPKIFGRTSPYVGIGFSANATPSIWVGTPQLSAPPWSAWFNLEVGVEHRGQGGFFVRAGLGPTILMNTGYFTNLDFNGFYGPSFTNSIGAGPVAAADAHDQGAVLALFMLHVDVGGVTDL